MYILRTSYRFILITISILPNILVSQNTETNCGTTLSPNALEYINSIKPQLQAHEQAFTKKGLYTNTIVNSIPIKAHVIRSSRGEGGLCDEDLYEAITTLNTVYEDAYMEFFLCDGINYIDNDALCHFKKGDEISLTESNNVSGPINIYFTNYIKNTSDESICGYSLNEGRQDIIVINNDCATNGSSLAHEMGHFFSLLHTHGNDNTSLTSELVDGSNCDTDGDGICDTPADPMLGHDSVDNFCNYIGTETDAHGDAFHPDVANIMSYSRKGCRNHFTPQQLARMRAFYLTAKSYLSCPDFNANFTVDTNQTCEEELTVTLKNSCSAVTNWAWDIDSDGAIDYTTQNITHTFGSGIYDVTLTVSNTEKTITKTFAKHIKVGTQAHLLDENFDDFEIAGDHGWTANDVSENGYNWYANLGQTASHSTGPDRDNTAKNSLGKYIYAEASGAQEGDITELISPCFTITNENSELEFAYHMFGDHIGELHVDIKTASGYINDVIPALYGSQQKNQDDDFYTKNIDLSEFTGQTIKIRFRAVRGSDWDGDIAIDDVFVKTIDIATPITDTEITVYPNPIHSNMIYIKSVNQETLLHYSISNFMGQTVQTGIVDYQQPINVGYLASGTYFLTLNDGNNKIVKKVFK